MPGRVRPPGPGKPPAEFTAELDVCAMQNVEASVGVFGFATPTRVMAFVIANVVGSDWPEHGRTTGAPWQLPAPVGQSVSDKQPRNVWIEQN